MEKWSFREQVLLGYNSRDSIGNRSFSVNASPQIPYRNSNANRRALDSMDFNDVFGGPPRRCSFVRDSRYSLNEAIGGDPVLFKEEALQSQGPELREKPVFGGDGPKCKNHLGEDFFGDIFGGEDSSRMPRRKSRGPFGSSPASRMVSPVIPSRPYSEKFSGRSSLPPELSLPSKLGKRIDHPAFGSASGSHSPNKHKQDASNPSGFSSSPSVLSPKMTAFDNNNSKFQTHLVQGLDDSRNGARTPYRQGPLSNQFSLNCDDGSSEATESTRLNSEKPDSDNEFHFSIHKWASKGITLLMPARGGNLSKDRDTKVTKAGLPPKAVFPGADNISKYENPSIISRDPKTKENCLQQETKLPSISSSSTLGNVEKMVPASPQASRRPGSKSLHSLFKVNSVDSSRSDNNLPKVIGNEVPVSVQEECKSELKIHDNLQIDKADERGKETIVGQAGGIEGKPLSNILSESTDDGRKVKSTRKNTQKNVETTSPTLRDLTVNSETRVHGNSVKGKVKEFVKMFNQEASQKSTHKFDIKNHSSRVKESEAHKVEDQISISTVKLVEEEKMVNGNRNTALADAHAPVAAVDIWREAENADLDTDFTVHHVEDSLSETIEISLPCFESIPESFGNKVNNIEESRYGNLQKHCPVEKIPEEQKQHPQMGQDQELQSYDSNIQNWSRGKEGNIRSLLSTLQYVLWPNSGWKPIALMDIIEGNSVKRAYQKALLCLHPDKLQQKGVTVLQKHIAEKVFEILQEAWSQFNSIGSF